MSYLILDADFLAFTVACVYQETYILATHPALPEPVKLKNITELWGKPPKRDGGFVQEYNELNFANLKPSEFSYTEHQAPLSLDDAKRSIDTRIKGLLEETGASSYIGFVGRGEVFRVELSTLLRYKGTRLEKARPLHLSALKQYLVDNHNCSWVELTESDDAVSSAGLAAYQKWKKTQKDGDKGIMVFEDRDLTQVDGWQYHVGQMDVPELRVGLGKLWRDSKGKVRGWGRLHLYWQTMRQEKSDNFDAACFSDLKWGDVKAFNLLESCKTDAEAFAALVKGFKILYPEPKVVVGWRGRDSDGELLDNHKEHEIEIDWLYVLNECFNMAKMLRSLDEKPTNIKSVLQSLNIEH